jgi:hypothetical protein
MQEEREPDEGWGHGEGEDTVESPETLSPDERGEDPAAEDVPYVEPKEP